MPPAVAGAPRVERESGTTWHKQVRAFKRDLLTAALEAVGASDCFVFCHGWLYDQAEAQQEAARFFALLEAALAPLRGRITPLRVALHWPSKPFADPELTRHSRLTRHSTLARGTDHAGLWP